MDSPLIIDFRFNTTYILFQRVLTQLCFFGYVKGLEVNLAMRSPLKIYLYN